ncbi:MAG TPA: DNA polymerase III subunit delta' [Caulobacteraceae bacterium]|jgi:DNA polymerase-3 subunit delta'|nr:DNA polymerase III subunit delta' [Caulobacteraceae bacterium]
MADDIAVAHPRAVFAYEQGEAAERAFLDALGRNRLHHAWLLCGPEGVGKATFAYRAARRLLGAASDAGHGLLGARPEDPVSRQIIAHAHPDLMVLERVGEDGKVRKVIPVDDARRLPEFFSKAPGSAPWRVAIVDSVDDMNSNAANALLKTLEEPPERGILFLVSHSPGGLLPTIRSRCRRLSFRPWPTEAVAAFVQARADVSEEDAIRLARMAKGSPGQALSLAARGAIATDDTAHELLVRLPDIDHGSVQALAENFRGAEGFARFELLFERLADQVHAMEIQAAMTGPAPSDRWGAVWAMLRDLPREVEGLNLDRADALWSAVTALRSAARA